MLVFFRLFLVAQSNFDDFKRLESLIELAIFLLIKEPTSEWYTKLGETVG